MMMSKQLKFLWAEFLLLYGGIPPLLIYAPRSLKVVFLLSFAVYALVMLRRTGTTAPIEWNWQGLCVGMPDIFCRTLFGCAVLTLLLLIIAPERLLSFPLERPQLWAMVMWIYPILSVLPQELIFRSLYFQRYAVLFKGYYWQIGISGILFAWAHILFMNWLAIILCGIGGILFAQTYIKHRSLALVWLEHSIYGCFIFTIGLGWYFYSGAVR